MGRACLCGRWFERARRPAVGPARLALAAQLPFGGQRCRAPGVCLVVFRSLQNTCVCFAFCFCVSVRQASAGCWLPRCKHPARPPSPSPGALLARGPACNRQLACSVAAEPRFAAVVLLCMPLLLLGWGTRVVALHRAVCPTLRGGLPFTMALVALSAVAETAGRARFHNLWQGSSQLLVAVPQMQRRCVRARSAISGTAWCPP